MNVGEESPNVTKHESNQPAANVATNRQQTAAHCSERNRAQDSDRGRIQSEILAAGLQRHAAFLKQLSLMWTSNLETFRWSTRLQI